MNKLDVDIFNEMSDYDNNIEFEALTRIL